MLPSDKKAKIYQYGKNGRDDLLKHTWIITLYRLELALHGYDFS